MAKLQQVNKRFYKRVAEWIKFVRTFPAIRLSEVVCPIGESTEEFACPTEAMIEQWRGVLYYLAGI